jgi:hypothetical protein
VRFLWSSDQHTLHQTTPTPHILSNLSRFLLKENDLAKVDMVAFGGDFMERMVESPNEDMFKVKDWGRDFLHSAHDLNADLIAIWLAGTESHDSKQPRHFVNLAPRGMDVRYIDTLSIEVFPQLDDLSIMFVPDNMGKMTPDEIWERALQVLKANEMDKVDLIFFHGGFTFQLHAMAQKNAHLLERWETIVRYAIFAGHIHKPVQKGKLYTSGSFDRTAHGEEHPKGGYVVDLDKKKNYFNPVFWENKNALPYLTMDVPSDITPEKLITEFHTFIAARKLPPFSQLRIRGGKAEIVNPIVEVMKKDYPMFGIKAENEVDKSVSVDETLFDAKVYEGVSLTKENLNDSLMPEVAPRFLELGIDLEEAFEVLEEFK